MHSGPVVGDQLPSGAESFVGPPLVQILNADVVIIFKNLFKHFKAN